MPSTAALAGVYVFSIVTGLLLAEANINLMCELGQVSLPCGPTRCLVVMHPGRWHARTTLYMFCSVVALQGGVSITSIAKATLGDTGAKLSSAAYLFLHYALLVACEIPKP